MSRTLAFLAVLALAARSYAQSDDLMGRTINEAIEQSVLDVAPFHLTPTLELGTRYDSNAILTGGVANPDLSLRALPGLEAVFPVRNRALLELEQVVDFIYFRNLENLRNVGSVTRLGGAVGGKNLLARASGEFRSEKIRPSREIDIPVDQNLTRWNGSLTYALGFRTELNFDIDRYRVRVGETDINTGGVPLQSRLDRVESRYSVSGIRFLSTETAATLGGFVSEQVFDDASVGRDATTAGGFVGLVFSPTGNARGSARLGYESLTPEDPRQAGFRGIVGQGDVRLRLSERYALRATYSRELAPSVFQDVLYVVQNRWGADVDVYFGQQFFVRPGFEIGSNDYPATPDAGGAAGQVLILSRREISLSLNYRVSRNWLASVETAYSRRGTFAADTIEDRVVVNFGLRTAY